MNFSKKSLKLYAITDTAWLGDRTLEQDVQSAIKGGASMIQLREKTLGYDEFLAKAISLKKICNKYDVPLIINDNIEVAIASGADGVHVGQSDMQAQNVRELLGENKIIGVTAKTIEQAKIAEQAGADYLGSGAVFGTTTKLDALPMDMKLFSDICSSVSIPVCAIGGITKANLPELKHSGLSGVALVSTIFAADDIEKECAELTGILNKILENEMKKVLTIAGSDCSGGAGIQADLKTMTAHKVYGMSAITALTAQNTMGVTAISECSPEFVAQQLDAIFTDIVPDAVKIGMVASSEIIDVIAAKLLQYKAKNIVVDPVMVSTSGSKLICDDAQSALVEKLLPIGTVITPNIPEAEVLCGFEIKTEKDMVAAAKKIGENLPCAVLVKGGHLINDAMDLLYKDGIGTWFCAKRIDNPNTHGTGCTLSSAIACNLAMGKSLETSIDEAKTYLVGALNAQLDLGQGSGPLDHMHAI